MESSRAGAGAQSRHLVTTLMAHCRQQAAARGKANIAFRIGLSGPPGAGKSTFTGVHLVQRFKLYTLYIVHVCHVQRFSARD